MLFVSAGLPSVFELLVLGDVLGLLDEEDEVSDVVEVRPLVEVVEAADVMAAATAELLR